MLDFVKGLIREALEKSPTRLAGYGSMLALAAALYLANLFGMTLSPETMLAIGVAGGAIAIEVIRRLVYSPNTTQQLANAATFQPAGSAVDIGKPPDASPPLSPDPQG